MSVSHLKLESLTIQNHGNSEKLGTILYRNESTVNFLISQQMYYVQAKKNFLTHSLAFVILSKPFDYIMGNPIV